MKKICVRTRMRTYAAKVYLRSKKKISTKRLDQIVYKNFGIHLSEMGILREDIYNAARYKRNKETIYYIAYSQEFLKSNYLKLIFIINFLKLIFRDIFKK